MEIIVGKSKVVTIFRRTIMNLIEKIALTKIKGIGPRLGRQLLLHCGSVEQIFSMSQKELSAVPGIGSVGAEYILSKRYFEEAEKELEFVDKHGIKLVWWEDKAYPRRLKHCEDAPLVLYYKGTGDLNPERVVSIVGTRNATAYGKRIVEDLMQGLRALGVQIISGLAYGIDIQAHRQAVKHGISTVGVLGHGLDRIYPAAHREVARQMLDKGGLLTEFCSGTIPDRMNFPMRNRIIAGMADVTVVVEAAIKGGALITAEIANSYSRDVCAFPGSLDQEYSAGCNYLIKTHRAQLIRGIDDLCYLMGWEMGDTAVMSKQLSLLPPEMTKDESRVYDLLKETGQATIDEIALHCDWPQSKLAMILLEMEMKGIIVSLPGKLFKLV